MNKYVSEILKEIKSNVGKNEISLIRLEGIDNPSIYRGICEHLNSIRDYNLIAKLSIDKLKKFEDRNEPKWRNSISYLKDNNYIDTDGTMTKIRNSSIDYFDIDKKTVILLMGTEEVEDKGGLADFYCISPDIILKKIKKNYAKWFEELFEKNEFKDKNLKSIHNIFKTIFKYVNIDLIKYSNLIQDLEGKSYYSEQELCEEIYYNLNYYWGIPSIRNSEKVPKINSLSNGNKDCNVINKSIKFINRSEYKDLLTTSKLEEINKKLEAYSLAKELNEEEGFPSGYPIFSNYEEFKSVIIDFINGKNINKNKEKLLKVDFSIIDEILKIKNTKESPDSNEKDKSIQLTGEPITVYSKMIIRSIINYKAKYNQYPTKINIEVDEITLNNCINEEEKHNDFIDICSFLGGIVEFIVKNRIYTDDGELIEIKYKDNLDVFDLSNYEILDQDEFFKNIKMTEKPSSKIKYTVVMDNENGNENKLKVTWPFKCYDSWKNSFYILNKYTEENQYPLFAICKDIHTYINCESEDEFFINLEKINLKIEESKIVEKIKEYLPKEIYKMFMEVLYDFKYFQDEVKNKGYYNTISNTSVRLISSYINLINKCKDEFDNLTSIQKQYLHLILNIFIITKKEEYGFKKDVTSDTIIPPYNPIMLEKIKDRMNFIKDGYGEAFEAIDRYGKLNNNKITDKITNKIIEIIDKYDQLASITTGVEVLKGEKNNLILTSKVYGFYSIYKDKKNSYNIASDNVFDHSDIVEDEELNVKELLKMSPHSKIIFKNIINYLNTFPYKIDGLNILIVNPYDMQYVVSGIHSVIDDLKNRDLTININLRILVSHERKNGSDFLRYWLDNYFSDDNNVTINTFVNYLDFDSRKLTESMSNYIDNQDISFIYDIMVEKDINFLPDKLELQVAGNFKFPMVYVPQPVSKTQSQRSTVISQFQFDGAKAYTQLMNLNKYPNAQRGTYRVAKTIDIPDNFKGIIDLVHENSNWVICADEGMDRRYLDSNERKIIGFSTGEGAFGELNITVSAHNEKINDIKNKLRHRLKNKFSKWSTEDLDESAKFCIDKCESLDGSRLLEALNPNDYEIHSFLAYVLTLQSLGLDRSDDRYIIRTLVNLDSHRHWFEGILNLDSGTNSRPDLLLLEIENNDRNIDNSSKLKIKATVIECKMGFENVNHIEKAKKQVKVGIQTLASNWNPNSKSSTNRYWYNQLYRSLVFSTLNMHDNDENYINFVNKLYSILEGNFEMEFNGKILAYWINNSKDTMDEENILIEGLDDVYNINQISLCTAGQIYIQKVLLSSSTNIKSEIEFYDLEPKEENDEEYTEGDMEIEDSSNETLQQDESNIVNNCDKRKIEEIKDLSITKQDQDSDNCNEDNIDMELEEKEIEETRTEEENDSIFDVNKVRILLGEDIRTKQKYYWEFGNKELNNRHLLISGNSGMGKTYCIQALLYELSKQGVSSIIFDYTDGFTTQKLVPLFREGLDERISERFVKVQKFPINPFIRQNIQIGNEFYPEENTDIANRISSVFESVYSFGPQQKNIIYKAVRDGLKEHDGKMSFETMMKSIEEYGGKTAETVLSKIMPFIDINPFNPKQEFSWKDILDDNGKVYIIQLTGFDRQIQIMLTELILWDIWNYAVRNGDESNPFTIVLDEAQNLNHSDNSPSGMILREGRKFGISGWFATQYLKGALNDNEIQNLQQSPQKLYFAPPDKTVKEIAKDIDITQQGSNDWAEKLKKLKKGECVTCGSMVRNEKFSKYEPRIIKISSLEERINE